MTTLPPQPQPIYPLVQQKTLQPYQAWAQYLAAADPLIRVLPLRSYLAGLGLANDGVSPNTVLDIAAGMATSDDQTTMMVLGSNYTKNCNAAWAVGTGNGALSTDVPSQILAATTWYYVFVIERTDTGVVDILVSTSATSPTLPTPYTKKRRVGAIRTNGSSQINAFTQFGDEFLWTNPTLGTNLWQVSNATTTANVLNLFTVSIPLGVKVVAIINAATNAGAAANLTVCSPDQTDTSSAWWNLGANASVQISGQYRVRSNTSSQIGVLGGTIGNYTGLFMAAVGWVDRRGQDA